MKWQLILLLAASTTQANELEEVKRLAPKYKAKAEVRLRDGSRVDLINSTQAIEVDYSRKWAEGIGQSLHYAMITNRSPGLILLVRDPAKEWRNLVRAARVCGKYDIELYLEKTSN